MGSSDQSLIDRVGACGDRWIPTELGADQRDNSGILGRRGHLCRLGTIDGHWLFAHDVVARGDRLHHEFVVGVGRRGNRDHVGGGLVDRVLQRDGAERNPGPIGAPLGALGIATDERDHLEPCGTQCRDMNPKSKTCSDHYRTFGFLHAD